MSSRSKNPDLAQITWRTLTKRGSYNIEATQRLSKPVSLLSKAFLRKYLGVALGQEKTLFTLVKPPKLHRTSRVPWFG
jgi:hypothetical protein